MVELSPVQLGRDLGLGFFAGLRYPFRGFRFVYLRHPGLVRFWIWPILVVFGLAIADLVLAFGHGDDLVSLLVAAPEGDGLAAASLRFAHRVAGFLASLVVGGLGLVAVALVSPVLAAPFNDALSEEVERLVTGREGPPFGLGRLLQELVRTLRVEGTKLLVYACVMGPLFVLSWALPVVGQVVYTAFGFFFTAAYWAADYVDWPASRRGYGVRVRVGLLRRNLPTALGFGTGVAVLLFVPFVQLFFMPAAVAGGTLLFLDLEARASGAASSTGTARPGG